MFSNALDKNARRALDDMRLQSRTREELQVQDLEHEVMEAALSEGLLGSKNQEVRMFLNGSHIPFPTAGILWSNWASFAPPSKLINSKTDVGKLPL